MSSSRKYWAIFRTTLINSLAYPGELVGRSLMILPFMWIFYQLWQVTFAGLPWFGGSSFPPGIEALRERFRDPGRGLS